MARNALVTARTAASARSAPTYPRTPIGGVYIPGAKSIEGATGDIALENTDNWIENRKYGWYFKRDSITTASGEFDTAITRTGLKTLLLTRSGANQAGGYGIWCGYSISSPWGAITAAESKTAIKLKPSTEYTLSIWIKTNNIGGGSPAGSQGANSEVSEKSAALAHLARNATTQIQGTNDWTLYTKTFTTNASTAYGIVYCNLYDNSGSAWFDINSMTLVETGVTRNAVV